MESPIQPIFFDILLHEIDQVGDGEKDGDENQLNFSLITTSRPPPAWWWR